MGTKARRWLVFVLSAHALWFFGNLYEEVVFVPNGVMSTVTQMSAFNTWFTVTKSYAFYVPLTQAGALALFVLAIAGRRSWAKRGLVRAAIASWAAMALTAFIVTRINVRLWLGDVRGLEDDKLHWLMWQWGALNGARLVLVGFVVARVFALCIEASRRGLDVSAPVQP